MERKSETNSRQNWCGDFQDKLFQFTANLSETELQMALQYIGDIRKNKNSLSIDQCPLTKREQDVLILIANGYSRKAISSSLNISANTAARHIANIYTKLEISCVAEATRYAVSCGFVKNIF